MRYWQSCASRSSAEQTMVDVSPVLCTAFNGGILVLATEAGRSIGGCVATGDIGFIGGCGVTGLEALVTGFVAMMGRVFFTGSALADDNGVPPASNFSGSKFG